MEELNKEPLTPTNELSGPVEEQGELAEATAVQDILNQESVPGLQALIQRSEQRRRPLREYVKDLKTVRALLLTISLAAGAAACGSGASADKAPKQVGAIATTTVPKPSTTPSSTTTTVPPTPTKNYVALCDGMDIAYMDPTTGKTLKTVPVYSNFGTFTPSVRYDSNNSGDENPTCGQWSYNGTLTEISGLSTEKAGTVPAVYNLLTGKITDLVAPPPEPTTTTTAPFAAQTTTPPSYLGAYFNPANQDVYWLESLDGGNTNEILDSAGVVAKYGYTSCNLGITFAVGSETPVAGCPNNDAGTLNDQAGNWSEPLPVGQEQGIGTPVPYLPTQESQFGVNFALPTSNYYWNIIRRSDDGKMAAFVGYKSTQEELEGPFVHSDCTLFTVGVEEGTPQGISQLPSCGSPYTYDVIRYVS